MLCRDKPQPWIGARKAAAICGLCLPIACTHATFEHTPREDNDHSTNSERDPETYETAMAQSELVNGAVAPGPLLGAANVGGCTGTVLNGRWVLTAAHCFRGLGAGTRVTSFGQSATTDFHLFHPKSRNVYTADAQTADIDVALLHLSSPIELDAPDRTISPLTTEEMLGRTAICFGAGPSQAGGSCQQSSDCPTNWSCNKFNRCVNGDRTVRFGAFRLKENRDKPYYYELDTPSLTGQFIVPGDSGGACWLYDRSQRRWEISGVNKATNGSGSYARQTSAQVFAGWVQSVMDQDTGSVDPRRYSATKCSAENPCQAFQGHCDNDRECAWPLVCGRRIGAATGRATPDAANLCKPPPNVSCDAYNRNNYQWNFCSRECPCSIGEGNCSRDADCRGGLVCAQNVGGRFGLRRDADLCVVPMSAGYGSRN